MENFDVAYRLETGEASLVAQHVPQVRPDLPWLPEEEPKEKMRKLGMVCVMDEAPPGLVPWMIVRTHDYAFDYAGHRLHWQKGMFLRNTRHGEAMLELREREFHFYAEAIWPEYFMNVLRQTLDKLISDNWPGMKDRYYFGVPCQQNECSGRFDIGALRQFLEEGDDTIRCQVCRTKQNIVELLYGFMEEDSREELARIEGKLDRGFDTLQKEIDGLESRLSFYVMSLMKAMANEAKNWPRLFILEPIDGEWYKPLMQKFRLQLWCEFEGCYHPVEEGLGVYEFEAPYEWVQQVAPYVRFAGNILKTVLPMIEPAIGTFMGQRTLEKLNLTDRIDLMKQGAEVVVQQFDFLDPIRERRGLLSEPERAGVSVLHRLLNDLDPNKEKLGLHRVSTYTGDYLWLCQEHYKQFQPKIPDVIE